MDAPGAGAVGVALLHEMPTTQTPTQHPAGSGLLRHAIKVTRDTLPPLHPGGRPFVIGGIAATIASRLFSRRLSTAAGIGTLATAAFFREPARVPPTGDDLVVAPADGTVSRIDAATPPAELELGERAVPCVSIFLSLLDVHVQRSPAAGSVRRVAYRPGRFFSADLDKASEHNERSAMVLETTAGHQLVTVQIAGLLARRIVCQVGAGDELAAGTTYGLIRFGSRVDIYLPSGSRILARPGQRAIGGETTLAELPETASEN